MCQGEFSLSSPKSIVFIWILLFFRKEQAPSFLSTPSSPLYPVENDNITLQWTYTLDGTPLDQVEVYFKPADSSSFSTQRVARYRSGGTTQVASSIQDRFVLSLTDSQSTMTILRSHRSDSGTYELRVSPDDVNLVAMNNVVKISVKCEYKGFNYFLIETSTIILITIIIIIIIIVIIIIIIIIMNMRVMIFTLRLVVLWTIKLVVIGGLS